MRCPSTSCDRKPCGVDITGGVHIRIGLVPARLAGEHRLALAVPSRRVSADSTTTTSTGLTRCAHTAIICGTRPISRHHVVVPRSASCTNTSRISKLRTNRSLTPPSGRGLRSRMGHVEIFSEEFNNF